MTSSSSPVSYTAPTIDFEELSSPQRSPTESSDLETFRATRVLRCAWSDRLTLMDQLLRAYVVTSGSRLFIVGDDYPHRSGVYVRRVSSITGVGPQVTDSQGTKNWQSADLRVEYESRNFTPSGEGGASDSSDSPAEAFLVAEETITPSAEFTTLPTGKLYADASQNELIADANAPGILVPMLDYVYSYSENLGSGGSLSSDLVTKLFTVNGSAVTSPSLGLTFDAETLLFLGARVRSQRLSNGDRIVDVELPFRYRPTGWNKFFVTGEEDPITLYDDAGNILTPYTPTSFVSLFA